VFDNRNEQIKESQRIIKQTQLKIKERIIKIEKEIPVIAKRIIKLQKHLDEKEEDDIINILLRQINENEIKLNNLNLELSKLKIDYEIQSEKYNQTELEMTYYDVTERVNDWFYKLNIEEQRNELIRVITSCKIFNHHLVIEAGKFVFIFDIKQRRKFDMELLDKLNNGEVFKKYFIEMKGSKDARKYDGKLIPNIRLDRNEEIKMRVFQYLIKNYNIAYDISEKTNLIPFVSMRGLYEFEPEQFD
jgi:hypothetical protein